MSRNTEATDDVNTGWRAPQLQRGFFTQLKTDELAKGINEEVVRAISAKRNEPDWMLAFRLNAFNAWLTMEEPHWLKAHYDKLNYGITAITLHLLAATVMKPVPLSRERCNKRARMRF